MFLTSSFKSIVLLSNNLNNFYNFTKLILFVGVKLLKTESGIQFLPNSFNFKG